MTFFKRFFGVSTPGADKNVQRDIEQVASGQSNRLYPILKPDDWVGIKAGAIHKPFTGTAYNKGLVIALGFDAPDNFVFLTPQNLNGRTVEEAFEEACINLEELDYAFDEMDLGPDKILTASGNTFSSEMILSKAHLQKAHRILNTDEIWVSIARRTCMMIISKHADEESVNTFVYLHQYTWKDDSYNNAPVLNALLSVKNGELEGMLLLEK
ncbi:MAG: hypothetical protein IM638_02875 [Bacteroidetes bacterium]|nr:hypothetical protein [Bacteroidota bacterium]